MSQISFRLEKRAGCFAGLPAGSRARRSLLRSSRGVRVLPGDLGYCGELAFIIAGMMSGPGAFRPPPGLPFHDVLSTRACCPSADKLKGHDPHAPLSAPPHPAPDHP